MSDSKKEIVVWQKNFFRRTMNIYEPRGPKYRCTQCNEIYHTRLSILTHSKIHLKPFCIVCGLYTQSADQMQNHMKQSHRHLIDIIPILPKSPEDEKQNDKTTLNSNQNTPSPSGPPKKIKPSPPTAKKVSPTFTQNKHLISRFGRCINVKIPADF